MRPIGRAYRAGAMKPLLPVAALALGLLAIGASAQTPGNPHVAMAAKDAVDLPRQELTPQILYQYLLAEIAAQRGQFGLAAGAYLDLARGTR